MDEQDKIQAEKVLRHLCLGRTVDGVRFTNHFIYQLLLIKPEGGELCYLNLENEWCVYSSLPEKFPDSSNDMKELSIDEQMELLFDLRAQKIVDVKLGDTIPHLILTLESGKIMFFNGHDDKYECWGIAPFTQSSQGHWEVIAGIGDDMMVFFPTDFKFG